MSYSPDTVDLASVAAPGRQAAPEDADFFRILVESVDYALIMLDPGGHIVTWSAGAERTFGYRPAEAIGQHFSLFYCDSDAADSKPLQQLDLAVATGHAEEESRRVYCDGSTFWARQVIQPLYSADGQLQGYTYTARNIAKQKQAADQAAFLTSVGTLLAASLDYETTLSSIARIAVPRIADWCTVDLLNDDQLRQVALTHVNPQKEQLVRDYLNAFPRDAESARLSIELLHKGESILMPEIPLDMIALTASRDEDRALLRELRLKSLMVVPLIARGRPLGSISFVAAESGQVYDAKDLAFAEELARRAAMAIDNAQLYRRAQQEAERAEEARQVLSEKVIELERSNAELQQFAYVASHDLQEPLRMVASYTQLLSRRYKGKLDSDADEFIGYAVDGANRMQRLINDLLAYSRVSTRGGDFALVNVEALLGTTLRNLQAASAESGAQVTHDPLPTVLGDATQLGQLLQNLLGNAIKFHGEAPPQIHIGAEQQGKEWVFCVRDNGIGFAMDYAERIFAIFQRLHSRDEYPGTGIGLAVCKRVVERHGGRIWVESRPGAGTTFYFTLPTKTTANEH